MLEVNDLHVSYGHVEAVRGISLNVAPGKVTLVLGANGAGKTTTLRATAGLEGVKAGRVTIDGDDVTGMAPHKLVRRGLALVPEGRRVFKSLTVEENLVLGGFTRPRADVSGQLREIYEMFPILETRRQGQAGLLSGGEQQMLAFGRALMSRPKVMLMDEPSMGLAPAAIDVVLAHVQRIRESGIAILMVEQNFEAALEVADHVVTVTRGEVSFSGSVSEAVEDAALIRAFLGESAMADD